MNTSMRKIPPMFVVPPLISPRQKWHESERLRAMGKKKLPEERP